MTFIEKCPHSSGKYLLWRDGFYQDHRVARNQLLREFNTREDAEKEANLLPEIEKLIAKYQERVKELTSYSNKASNYETRDMLRVRAGQLIQVIDDLKQMAGIS